MKASEVKVGEDYLVNRSRDWQYADWNGYGASQRVRIHSTEVATWVWEVRDGIGAYVKTYKGASRGAAGILAYPVDIRTGVVGDRLTVVTPASVRGLWETTWPAVKENARQAREARQAERDKRAASAEKVAGAVSRILRECGMGEGARAYDSCTALVSLEVLEIIADALEIARSDREVK